MAIDCSSYVSMRSRVLLVCVLPNARELSAKTASDDYICICSTYIVALPDLACLHCALVAEHVPSLF